MPIRPLNLIVALTASAAVAQFLVLFYSHWFFASSYWPKWLILSAALFVIYLGLLRSRWEKLWLGLGIYWTVLVAGFMVAARSFDLSRLGFTGVLNLEAPMVWLPAGLILLLAAIEATVRERSLLRGRKQELRALQLRRRLRRRQGIALTSRGAAVMALPSVVDNAHAEGEALLAFPAQYAAGDESE
jgi:hypothetical protein